MAGQRCSSIKACTQKSSVGSHSTHDVDENIAVKSFIFVKKRSRTARPDLSFVKRMGR
jgi:hypothetical protein